MEAADPAASLGLEVPGVRELKLPDQAQPHAIGTRWVYLRITSASDDWTDRERRAQSAEQSTRQRYHRRV